MGRVKEIWTLEKYNQFVENVKIDLKNDGIKFEQIDNVARSILTYNDDLINFLIKEFKLDKEENYIEKLAGDIS